MKSDGVQYSFLKSIVLLFLICSSIVSGQPKQTLGFTILKASGIDPYDAKVYSQFLRTAVNKVGVYSVLEFSDISMRLAEQGMPDMCHEAQCAVVLGQILGTEFFGYGSIGKIGKTFIISMQILEVRTGRIIRDITEFYKGNTSGFQKKSIPLFAQRLCGIEVIDKKRKK